MQQVELIASSYEWTCPKCGMLNTEIEIPEIVMCIKCNCEFEVVEYYHAYR